VSGAGLVRDCPNSFHSWAKSHLRWFPVHSNSPRNPDRSKDAILTAVRNHLYRQPVIPQRVSSSEPFRICAMLTRKRERLGPKTTETDSVVRYVSGLRPKRSQQCPQFVGRSASPRLTSRSTSLRKTRKWCSGQPNGPGELAKLTRPRCAKRSSLSSGNCFRGICTRHYPVSGPDSARN